MGSKFVFNYESKTALDQLMFSYLQRSDEIYTCLKVYLFIFIPVCLQMHTLAIICPGKAEAEVRLLIQCPIHSKVSLVVIKKTIFLRTAFKLNRTVNGIFAF